MRYIQHAQRTLANTPTQAMRNPALDMMASASFVQLGHNWWDKGAIKVGNRPCSVAASSAFGLVASSRSISNITHNRLQGRARCEPGGAWPARELPFAGSESARSVKSVGFTARKPLVSCEDGWRLGCPWLTLKLDRPRALRRVTFKCPFRQVLDGLGSQRHSGQGFG